MDLISKQEWVDWKNNPVTQVFYDHVREELTHWNIVMENLTKFDDIGNIGRIVGMIQANRHILSWQPEWEEEESA